MEELNNQSRRKDRRFHITVVMRIGKRLEPGSPAFTFTGIAITGRAKIRGEGWMRARRCLHTWGGEQEACQRLRRTCEAANDFLNDQPDGTADESARRLRAAYGAEGRLGPQSAESMAAGEAILQQMEAEVNAITGGKRGLTNAELLQLADKYKIDGTNLFSDRTNSTMETFRTTNYTGAYKQQVKLEAIQAAVAKYESITNHHQTPVYETYEPSYVPYEENSSGGLQGWWEQTKSAYRRAREGGDDPYDYPIQGDIGKTWEQIKSAHRRDVEAHDDPYDYPIHGTKSFAYGVTANADSTFTVIGGQASATAMWFPETSDAAVFAGASGAAYSGPNLPEEGPVQIGYTAAAGAGFVIALGEGGVAGWEGSSEGITVATPLGGLTLARSMVPEGKNLMAEGTKGYYSLVISPPGAGGGAGIDYWQHQERPLLTYQPLKKKPEFSDFFDFRRQ